MKASEKRKTDFLKPKKSRMFMRKEYRTTKKGKVFGFTASTGHMLFALCRSPWNTKQFARLVRKRLGPFLRKCFPGQARIRILLDGEPLLHTAEAKAAFAEFGLAVMPDWPKYSPDLNPQENVWSWAEKALRKDECAKDTFADFSKRVLSASRRYPSAAALIRSMHGRMQEVIRCKGGMTKY